jgi:hypothetical protein
MLYPINMDNYVPIKNKNRGRNDPSLVNKK